MSMSTSSENEFPKFFSYSESIMQIIDKNEDNPTVQQTSLAELHRLSITLSNLYDVAPTIIGVGKDATISITPETKTSPTTNG